jgi:DNA-binding NtrC family response regulator
MSNTARVLLVDDEPILLGPLRRLIQRAHPEALVVYASDPSTAEWQIRSTPIRLVVTDMRMHSDSHAGLRVVAAAREAGVSVAVLTGADDDTLAELARGGFPVVSKRGSITDALSKIVDRAFAA